MFNKREKKNKFINSWIVGPSFPSVWLRTIWLMSCSYDLFVIFLRYVLCSVVWRVCVCACWGHLNRITKRRYSMKSIGCRLKIVCVPPPPTPSSPLSTSSLPRTCLNGPMANISEFSWLCFCYARKLMRKMQSPSPYVRFAWLWPP